jgi:hypothetical protein
MFNWYKEFLQIRYEAAERKLRLEHEHQEKRSVCNSCEVLKTALDRANYEKEQMLIRFTAKPEVIEREPPVMTQIPARQIPMRVKMQMMEAEDRQKALLLRKQKENSTAALEKQMGIDNAEAAS